MAPLPTLAQESLPAKPDSHDLTPLLQGAISGDRIALDALLGKLRPYLHTLVRARLGSASQGGMDHSALVQEGLVRIYKNIGQLRQATVPCLLGWVGQIMRHLAVDALRAQNAKPAQVLSASVLELLNKPLPADQLELRERRAVQVAQAIGQLPERRRQVLEMYFLEQLSDAEICQRMGGSPGAVRVLRFRALEDLRRLLAMSPDSDCRPQPDMAQS
jgi:RNA polymerase sigma-70 factor (ECF subfamily)